MLSIIWIGSIAVLVGVGVNAYRRGEAGVPPSVSVPKGFRDFLLDELHEFRCLIEHLLVHSRPHVELVGVRVVLFSDRVRNLFIERIYGRIAQERGSAASFFLKHIAEHKEEVRRSKTERHTKATPFR